MKRLYLEDPFFFEEQTVVCLGFFDGVHIGHMRLVDTAKEVARIKNLLVCVHTFATMPQLVVNPGRFQSELTPLPQKEALLAAAGVELLAISRFTDEMMHMRAKDFFDSILVDKLRARHIVVGFHHRFGYQGEMDAKGLMALCEKSNIGLSVVKPVRLSNGSLVSSTAIRSLLQKGEWALAEAMLGRKL